MTAYNPNKDSSFSSKRTAVSERRKPFAKDRRSGSVLDRRRGPGKRRSEDRRAAEEGQLTNEQFEFLMAIDEYKKVNQKPFPSWTEVLEVIKAMGYRKIAEPCAINEVEDSE